MASIDDLWMVDFGRPYPGEPAFQRPALIVGPPDTFGSAFPYSIVLPLTSSSRGLSLHVEVESSDDTGLVEDSYVQCEQIRSVNRKRLTRKLGSINAETSNRVDAVLKTLLNH